MSGVPPNVGREMVVWRDEPGEIGKRSQEFLISPGF